MYRNLFFFVLGFLLATGSPAQELINTGKAKAPEALGLVYPGARLPAQWKGDSLQAVIADSITAAFVFDAEGLCEAEIFICESGSRFTRQLEAILAKKKYAWKRLNENQFISRFEDGLLLEISPEPPLHSFAILRTGWTREVYDLLLKQD